MMIVSTEEGKSCYVMMQRVSSTVANRDCIDTQEYNLICISYHCMFILLLGIIIKVLHCQTSIDVIDIFLESYFQNF